MTTRHEYSLPWDEVERPRMSAARVMSQPIKNKFLTTNNVTFVRGIASCGQTINGPQEAAHMILQDTFLDIVKDLGYSASCEDARQVFVPTPANVTTTLHEPYTVAATCSEVKKQVANAHSSNSIPILTGGDHCLAIGSVSGSAQRFPELCVLWFGAHGDINTPETSPSGNMHGVPLSILLGRATPVGFEQFDFKCLSADRVGWIGLREVDDAEEALMKELKMDDVAFRMEDLNKRGIRDLTTSILKKINPNCDRPVHISFDIGGLDPMDAPSTGMTVPMGTRIHEALEMIHIVRETGCLVSLDIVEVNPQMDNHNAVATTIANARSVILEALGQLQK
eukprot:GILI01015923.1.p1 GENE.GILI01015923.1~~GILI01015923.1.p1  ORF type:complete len:358 (+),score=58.54 GILI01015923.1:63-1076(+)